MIVSTKELIEEGDIVIIYEGVNNMTNIRVKKGDMFQNNHGSFRHTDLIGVKYGSKIYTCSKGMKGWIVVLRPTPELWTSSLKMRTAILYHADIAMILMGLDVKPGCVVYESGTGSGSLSTAFVRSLAPHGHLHTFEFNENRVLGAREDFKKNGIDHLVTVRQRDVCGTGFPTADGGVDAVFLDVPRPWEVIKSAYNVLNNRGRLCSFSPCIEQVQRTCDMMRENFFTDIRTVECLEKKYESVPTTFTDPDLGYGPEFDADSLLNIPSAKAESEKSLKRKKPSPSDDKGEGAQTDVNKKNKTENGTGTTTTATSSTTATTATTATVTPTPAAPASTTTASTTAPASAPSSDTTVPALAGLKGVAKAAKMTVPAYLSSHVECSNAGIFARPIQYMRGHTGYLIFAKKIA